MMISSVKINGRYSISAEKMGLDEMAWEDGGAS